MALTLQDHYKACKAIRENGLTCNSKQFKIEKLYVIDEETKEAEHTSFLVTCAVCTHKQPYKLQDLTLQEK